MSRRGFVRGLLCLLFLGLLCSSILAFNPHDADEGDEAGSGSAPSTSTLRCAVDPATGAERCESEATLHVPDEAELARKVEEAEAERLATQKRKAEARAQRIAREEEEKAARRAKREAEAERSKAEHEEKKQKRSADDYKLSDPLKKLKVNYYRFFGVEADTPKLRIRKAANTMALENHPDKCPTQVCKDRMLVINQARDVLLDDATRAEYDFLLRWGFKVYDKELYDDIYELYQEGREDEIPHGFDDDAFDPSSDYSSMNVSAEGAGWLLLLCGGLTLAMLAWPVVKFWEKRGDAEARRVALKNQMLAAKHKGAQALSIKKKTERFTGDRTVKRFVDDKPQQSPKGAAKASASPSPSPSPKSANGPSTATGLQRRASPVATSSVALLCVLGLLCLVPFAAQAEETTVSYYELLEVSSGVDALGLKKA